MDCVNIPLFTCATSALLHLYPFSNILLIFYSTAFKILFAQFLWLLQCSLQKHLWLPGLLQWTLCWCLAHWRQDSPQQFHRLIQLSSFYFSNIFFSDGKRKLTMIDQNNLKSLLKKYEKYKSMYSSNIKFDPNSPDLSK